MKKGILVLSLICTAAFSSAYAEYTLTSAENIAVQKAVQKIQTKPLRVQEALLNALKKKASSTQDEHRKALYAAFDAQLRQKTASGDLLATSIERKEIIQSLFAQNTTQKQWSATVKLSGKITSLEEGVIDFEMSALVDADMKKIENPKVRIQGDASLKNNEMSTDIAGEMRVVDMVGYFMLKKLSFSPDEEDNAASIKPFLGVWWKLSLDTDAKKELQVSLDDSAKNNQKIKNIVTTKNVLPTLLYNGQKDGISTYSGVIDNTALANTLVDVITAQGETITEQDKKDLAESLQGIVMRTTFSLDEKKQLSALALTATFRDKELDNDIISGSVTLNVTNSSKISPITAPKNARDANTFFQM